MKAMREQGAPIKLCAAALGISASTVRRSRCTRSARSTSSRRIDAAACQQVRTIVRATHGLVGAANLRLMSGLPRRICAEIKLRELRELEYERKARCASISIVSPRIVRGFDAMHVACNDARAYWLVAADAAVPYRTSILTTLCYDAESVIAALRNDFETHGPPFVLRLDRAACQRTPEVLRLLEHYEVLPLHGPARHPRYYGQLERQNREHRAWYNRLPLLTAAELAQRGEDMRRILNELWPRPTLAGWTSQQAWDAYTAVDIDRRELRRDVEHRAARLRALGYDALHAQRLAIESALQERQLLHINHGGWR